MGDGVMEERRAETSILLQLVQTVHDDVKTMAQRLDTHMIDEEAEMIAMRKEMDDIRHESEARHATLIQSINSYMDKSIAIEEAFLKDHEGKPDLRGHYEDHSYRKKVSDWLGEAWGGAWKKVFEYGLLAGLAWIGYELWIAFLKGPKG